VGWWLISRLLRGGTHPSPHPGATADCLDVFGAWDFLAAVRKSQTSILRANEQLLKLESSKLELIKIEFQALVWVVFEHLSKSDIYIEKC
jgi:hypothetical protein